MKIGDQPAFSFVVDESYWDVGMTYRQLLIAAALSGIGFDTAQGNVITGYGAASQAIERADAALKLLEKEVADAKPEV